MKRFLSVMMASSLILSLMVPSTHVAAAASAFTFSATTVDPIKIAAAEKVEYQDFTFGVDENIEIERDFDQIIPIMVINNTNENVTFHMETTKQYDDLPTDFTGYGSIFKDAIVMAGSTTTVNLRVFAQIAEKGEYTIPFKAVSTDGNTIAESSVSFKCPTVDMSKVSIELIDTDEATLAKTYRITNNGSMDITSVHSAINSEDCEFYTEPSFSGMTLAARDSEDITVYPDLDEMASLAIDSAKAELTISAGGQSLTYEDTFDASGTIELITAGELAMIKNDNWFADIDPEPVSAVLTINGIVVTADNIDSLAIYDQNNESVISVKNTYRKADGTEFAIELISSEKNSTATEDLGFADSIQYENGVLAYTATTVIAPASTMSLSRGAALVNTAKEYTNSVYMSGMEEIWNEATSELIEDEIKEHLGEQLYNFIQSQKNIGDTISAGNDIADDISTVKDILNNPDASASEKAMSGLDIANKYLMGDVESEIYDKVKDDIEDNFNKIEQGINDIINWFNDVFDQVFSGSGHTDDNDDWVSSTSNDIYYADNQSFKGSSCANQQTKYMNVDCHGNPVNWSMRSVSSDSVAYIINRQYSRNDNNIYTNETTNYVYTVNGTEIGSTQTNGTTDLAIAKLDTSYFVPGKNKIEITYDTTPGEYAVITDYQFIQNIPSSYTMGYIGDISTLPEVRALPDYAIYSENIYSDSLFFTEGQNSDFSINVYNRGSAGGYVLVLVTLNGTVVYDEILCMPAFSEQVCTFSAQCAANNNISVQLIDMNCIDCEVVNDNNYAEHTFKSNNNITLETRVTDRSSNRLFIGDKLDAGAENTFCYTNDKLYIQAKIGNFSNNGNNLIESCKVYLNDEYVSEGMDCSDFGGTLVYTVNTLAPVIKGIEPFELEPGENTLKIVVTYKNSDTTTAEISQTAAIYYNAPVNYEVNWDESYGELQTAYIIFDDGKPVEQHIRQNENGYYLSPSTSFYEKAIAGNSYTVVGVSNKGIYQGDLIYNYDSSSNSIVFTDENNVVLNFESDDAELAKVYITDCIIDNGEFNFDGLGLLIDTTFSAPCGEYGYRAIGIYNNISLAKKDTIEVSKDTLVAIKFRNSNSGSGSDSEDKPEMNLVPLTIKLDGYSADAVITLYLNGSTELNGENGVFMAPEGVYSLLAVVESAGYIFEYEIENVNTSGSPTYVLSNELTTVITDNNPDYTYKSGEGLMLMADKSIVDKNGNVLVGAYSAEGNDISATITFINIDTKEKSTSNISIDEIFDHAYCTVPYDLNGDYMVSITVNCNAPSIEDPDNDNQGDSSDNENSGGSSGGNSGIGNYIPSRPVAIERTPKYNGIEKSWSEIAQLIESLPIGEEITIELNGTTDVPIDVVSVIADRDVQITFKVDAARSWHIDGAKISSAQSADLRIISVAKMNTSKLNGIVGTMQRINNTNLPTELSVVFSSEHYGKFVNLYKIDNNKSQFVNIAMIDATGIARIADITDEGDYVFMISEYSDCKGDANNDGIVNALDASTILKDIVDLEKAANPKMLDFNNDGMNNALDASDILKWLVS